MKEIKNPYGKRIRSTSKVEMVVMTFKCRIELKLLIIGVLSESIFAKYLQYIQVKP